MIARTIYRCPIHCDEECQGLIIIRKSVYGAIVGLCERGWNEDYTQNYRTFPKPDLALWPEIISYAQKADS